MIRKFLLLAILGTAIADNAEEYDFIIVGAGSAGSVLANRLSEKNQWKILLLEVGTKENVFSRIPIAAPLLQSTRYNWKYFTEVQPNMSLGLNDRRMKWPRGKALGGSSVINYMMYTRGHRLNYDRWAAAGNPGWSYEDVFPYFVKSEKAKLSFADYDYHGTEGYLSVQDSYQSKLVEVFIEAGQQVGLPHIDYNANVESFGVSAMQATLLKGKRHTIARAFLFPIDDRPNLRILTLAFVTKVLINPDSKEAYGVEYERFGKKHVAHAKKEVILSAGSFNSPQLLILAGIGPKQHLEELDIPLLQDLPVGQNLHDHLSFPGLSFLINEKLSLSLGKLVNPINILKFFLNGTGPYTSLGGVEGIGYIKTDVSTDPDDIPDIELIFTGACLATDYGLFTRRDMNIRDDIYNSVFRPIHNKPCWAIFPMLLHPKSRGYIKLRSKDPHDYPLMYGNYLSDPDQQDIKTFLAAIRFIQKMSRTPAFQKYDSKLNQNPIPGCESHEFDSDDYWMCAFRSICVTLHHQLGTAKMGPSNDSSSVVDHELKVHGIKRLRVADCSIIPFAVGAHTNAVSTMVGERAADIIKKNWGEL